MFSLNNKALIAISLLLLSSHTFADTRSAPPEQLLKDMQSYSQQLGVDIETWRYAVTHFEMANAGDITTAPPHLDERPLYHKALATTESQEKRLIVTKLMNQAKAEYASFLGLETKMLEDFLTLYTDLKAEDGFLNFESPNDGVESVTLVCDSQCQQSLDEEVTPVKSAIYKLAQAANIAEYQLFAVKFSASGDVANHRYNKFSGVWKVEI